MATSTFTLDNIRICCTVNGTKVDADFDYYPTEEELRNVITFLLKDESPSNLPSLIDCTVIRPNLLPLDGHTCTSSGCELCHPVDDLAVPEEEPCKHARVMGGRTYGGPCELEHEHKSKSCGYCLKVKPNLVETGNSLAFICPECVEDNQESDFCYNCGRFEETNDHGFCGKCQKRPSKELRKKYKVCQSFHDTEWDLMNEEI